MSTTPKPSKTTEDRPIRRRVRTGCQRCRTRRRKCDERKPVCSNCADRNFECQYGLRLRFPSATAHTAPPPPAETPSSTVRYTQITFVGDDGDQSPVADTSQHASGVSHTRSNSQRSTNSGSISAGVLHSSADSSEEACIQRSLLHHDHNRRQEQEQRHQQQQQHQNVADFINPIYQDARQFTTLPGAQDHATHHASMVSRLDAGSAEHGAVQSLVSLATSLQSPCSFQNGTAAFRHEDDLRRHGTVAPTEPAPINSAMPSNIVPSGQPPNVSTEAISEERTLELLRYYRYHVAPWLDMLDLNHHLGLYLPALGAESPPTTYALYSLSARHAELVAGVPDMAQFESDRYYNLSKWGTANTAAMNTTTPTNSADALEACLLRLITDLISTPFDSWAQKLAQATALLQAPATLLSSRNASAAAAAAAVAATAVHEPGLTASLLRCIFRFDLASALATESRLVTKSDALGTNCGIAGAFEEREDVSAQLTDHAVCGDDDDEAAESGAFCVDRDALRALLLCGQAVRVLQDHRQSDHVGGGNGRHSYLTQWQKTWAELAGWYASRRRFLKPLLELPASSASSSPAADETGVAGGASASAFPTIVFSTAAATLANLVYHTAAMVLLDCKPKTIKIPTTAAASAAGEGRQTQHHHQHRHRHPSSPTASLHWHAQRTCAIAVSSAGLESWDPCMVACVLRAARKMTHSDQQVAVLATLELARDATGWKIDGDLQTLREFWRLAEHS